MDAEGGSANKLVWQQTHEDVATLVRCVGAVVGCQRLTRAVVPGFLTP